MARKVSVSRRDEDRIRLKVHPHPELPLVGHLVDSSVLARACAALPADHQAEVTAAVGRLLERRPTTGQNGRFTGGIGPQGALELAAAVGRFLNARGRPLPRAERPPAGAEKPS